MLVAHEVCHSAKINLLIDCLKLENGILKEVCSNVRGFLFVGLPFHFL